ncbi:hypothetical protein Tco_0791388 [Tanacetum coccineum]
MRQQTDPRDVNIASLKQQIQELKFPRLQQDSPIEETETKFSRDLSQLLERFSHVGIAQRSTFVVAQEKSEIPYDTESEIKVIKRYQPTQMDDEDQIIFLGIKDDDMDQHVEDEVVSISGFGTDDSNKEGIEYTMIVDALEERMLELISDSLKNILPQIIKDSFQHVLPKIDQRVHETL